ncbi:unnamed protein product, partial [Phaeothamnion confervicola]
ASITQLVSGLNTVAMPSCEILYLRRPPYDSRIKTLIVALSRTAESEDTIWAVEKLKKLHATCKVITITAKEGRLETFADQKIVLPKTLEDSNLATRTPSSMLLTTMVLTSWISNKEVFINELVKVADLFTDPAYLKGLQDQARKLSVPKPIPIHFTFLGTGPYLGVAMEGARKIREMTQIPAEHHSVLEFRQSNYFGLSKDSMVVSLLSDTMRKAELEVIGGLAKFRPARVAVLEMSDEQAKMRADFIIELKSKVSEVSRVLLMYPVMHLICFYMSIAKGKNPEKLMHLEHQIPIKERPGV